MTEVYPQNHVTPEATDAEQAPFEYKLLVGHERTSGRFKTDEELKTQYIHLTDQLVSKLTNGVDIKNTVTGEVEKKAPDVVVWLDKSARPVSWLTKELWPVLAPGSDGVVPKIPESKFVNIDREQWVNQVDPHGTGYMDIEKIDPTVIRSLRSIFVEPKYKKDGLTPDIDEAESSLDGKTVLIVDEVMSSGRTLDIAQKFFERAFPTAQIATAHWMGGIAAKGLATGNADIPIWYKEKDAHGRGVDNRNDRKSGLSNSLTQRLGAMFLSTRFEEGDEDGVRLRKELRQLAKDAEDKKVLIVPGSGREDTDYVERLERLNGMHITDFVAKKKAQDARAAKHERNKHR